MSTFLSDTDRGKQFVCENLTTMKAEMPFTCLSDNITKNKAKE